MMHRTWLRLGKPTLAGVAGGKAAASKLATDEKFGQSCLEYIYEMNRPNTPTKTRRDAEDELLMARAADRYFSIGDAEFHRRLSKLVDRGSDALAALPDELRSEACVLNSEMPPLSFRRPTLTPPLAGYDPAFGLDVPANRARVLEYPPVTRIDDDLLEADREYPLLAPDVVAEINSTLSQHLSVTHSEARSTIPQTGPMGEAWEAEMALQKRAVARQELILKLAEDPDLRERFDTDDQFRSELMAEKGLSPLESDPTESQPEGRDAAPVPPLHFAQKAKQLERKS